MGKYECSTSAGGDKRADLSFRARGALANHGSAMLVIERETINRITSGRGNVNHWPRTTDH